jgi:hypothetical protein
MHMRATTVSDRIIRVLAFAPPLVGPLMEINTAWAPAPQAVLIQINEDPARDGLREYL